MNPAHHRRRITKPPATERCLAAGQRSPPRRRTIFDINRIRPHANSSDFTGMME